MYVNKDILMRFMNKFIDHTQLYYKTFLEMSIFDDGENTYIFCPCHALELSNHLLTHTLLLLIYILSIHHVWVDLSHTEKTCVCVVFWCIPNKMISQLPSCPFLIYL